MAYVDNPLGHEQYYYMDDNLSRRLDEVKSSLLKDEDRLFIVDGGERTGKSVLAMQIAAKVDPSFNLSRVCMSPDEFVKAVENSKPYQAIVFDEAFTGLSSRNSMSRINNLLMELMMEMGQNNLFVIIVMPSIFFLDRYVVLHRATGLFHVYKKNGKRGFWIYFNKNKLTYLYLNGKKALTYSGKGVPLSNFKGRFYEKYVVTEADYRLKKRESLRTKSTEMDKKNVYVDNRDRIIAGIIRKFKLSQAETLRFLDRCGVKISKSGVSRAVEKFG